MKKNVLILLVMLCALQTMAQLSVTDALSIEDARMNSYLKNRKIPQLTIKVLNTPSAKPDITYTLVTIGPSMQIKKSAKLNEKNELKIFLDQNLPYQQIWLAVGNLLYTGIYVNTDLTIVIDADKTKKEVFLIGDGVEFSGTDGMLNKVMNKNALYRKKEKEDLMNLLVSKSLEKHNRGIQKAATMQEENRFTNFSDSIYNKLTEIDSMFSVKYPEFAWAVSNETVSDFYNWIITAYSSGKLPENIKPKIFSHKPYFVSNNGAYFYRSLTNYLMHTTERSGSGAFDFIYNNRRKYDSHRQLVLDSVKQIESMPLENQDTKLLEILYKERYSLFRDEFPLIRITLAVKYIDSLFARPRSDILKLFLMEQGKDYFQTTYPAIASSIKTGWCLKRINDEIKEAIHKDEEMKTILAKSKAITSSNHFIGKPLLKTDFGAELYKLDALKSIDSFIMNMKSKFKDKALIIDFWATWCAPCVSDLQYSKKLHEENKDLPIEYIYLCTDINSSEELWKKRVFNTKVPGIHIYVKDQIISELKKKFNAEGGFPTYVVIDRKGQVKTKAIRFMKVTDRGSLKQATGL